MSKAIPWQFTIRSEQSHFMVSCLLCLGIYKKEWVKPFHDELLVMFGNLRLGVSEAIPWWVSCYVWEFTKGVSEAIPWQFTIRSEQSHSLMSCLLCLGESKACLQNSRNCLCMLRLLLTIILVKEEKATLLILLVLTIILVGREAACFVLWFMKGRKKEILSLAVWVLL